MKKLTDLEKMERIKRWVNGKMYEIDWVLTLRRDIENYFHLSARNDKRLDYLERKLKELTDGRHST